MLKKELKKVSKVMMPILVVLNRVIISVYGLTLDGAMEGFVYYIQPHMSDVSVKTILAAMGTLLLHVSCNGNHGYLWLLYEEG